MCNRIANKIAVKAAQLSNVKVSVKILLVLI